MGKSTPTVDRTTAVLSIRPEYVDKILAGTKTIDHLLDTAIPDGEQKPLFVPGGGIDVDSLFAYSGGPLEPLTGIGIRRSWPTLARKSLGLSAGPQFFRYAPAEWRTELEVAW